MKTRSENIRRLHFRTGAGAHKTATKKQPSTKDLKKLELTK